MKPSRIFTRAFAGAILAGLTMGHVQASSLTVTGAVGEFENYQETERYTLEARIDGPAGSHFTLRGEHNIHPLDEIDDRTLVGGGYTWKGWRGELVGNDERFLGSLIYTAPTEVWELRGGILYGNRWEAGFKQTGLTVSVGYPLIPGVTFGGFYEVGNTTMKSVDDLYGGYLTWEF